MFYKSIVTQDTIKKYYIFGLIYFKFDVLSDKIFIRLFGLKIFGFIPFKSKIFTKKIFSRMLTDYLKYVYKIDDGNVIAFFNRSGETFLCCRYLKEFIDKNNLENVTILSPYGYNRDIFKMYYSEMNFCKIPKSFIRLQFCNINYAKLTNKLDYYNLFPNSHFVEYEKRLQKGENSYFIDELKKKMKVQGIEQVEPKVSPEAIQSAEIKLNKLNLTSKFVFISPDAQSTKSLSRDFWDKLAIALYSRGYDILYNVEPEKYENSYNKTCFLTLEEARYVATKAECVIGIRSGLFDIIAQKGVKVHCIYLPFSDRGKDFPPLCADKVMNAFTLKSLPNVDENKIFEYNSETLSESELLTEIISNIKYLKNLPNIDENNIHEFLVNDIK